MSKKKVKNPIEAGVCPVCGCPDLNYGGTTIEGELCGYDFDCNECKATGMEWHRLTFSSFAVRKPDGSYAHHDADPGDNQ